ncbi:necdin-like 2 [Erpetoichthys calabaricus]|uniref:Necdin-like 2 n=1 Tax=Erpetoichthys calabaricus TaxID=27687 RepID=A0A8C4TID4_ERPCA|nr:necdin-like 2 [Erpetoichthys calabaricus]XP_051790142.1 necdin-like 2 [Erpetoichthys calabaricus]
MSQKKRTSSQKSQAQSNRLSQVARNEAVDSDEEDVSLTEPSTSQVQQSLSRLTVAQVDRKMAEVLQFILIKDQKKMPIKRADIVKHVLKEYKTIYSEILKRVDRTLGQVFGMKLVEIDTKNHTYVLINKLEPVDLNIRDMHTGSPKTGLLFVILAVIFMKGGIVKESIIWNMLKKLKVKCGEKHEDFGDVKKLITEEFVRQRYLEYARVPHTDPIEYEFRWGLRAEKELSKMKLLELVSELQEQDPHSWTTQWKEAEQAESSSRGSSQ